MNTLFQKLQATDIGLYRTHLILPLRKMVRSSLMALFVATGLLTFHAQAQSWPTTILHNFGDGSVSNDGALLDSPVLHGTDGNFYGLTYEGGASNKGTIFKMTPGGTTTILHSFGSTTNDGASPIGALIQNTDGNFYGTTAAGGSANHGIVFKITASGTLTLLYTFGSITNDGNGPWGGLIKNTDGNFYGTTYGGGTYNAGTVFKMTPSGTLTILHSFGATTSDGSGAIAPLCLGADGKFYGVTYVGGSASKGTFYQITSTGTTVIRHSFGSTTNDGANPDAGVIQLSDGKFYSTTLYGGSANQGTAFKMTAAGAVTILHSFGSLTTDGSEPMAGFIQSSDSYLYGTTSIGGTFDNGTVFRMTTSGSVTVLHSFSSGDGFEPSAPLIEISNDPGTFYGTTFSGGSGSNGTVFRISKYGILYSFQGVSVNDGEYPMAPLVLSTDGSFYGTTYSGGAPDQYGEQTGTAFKITPSGSYTLLHSFDFNNEGGDLNAPLVLGTDGNFYGTCSEGGPGEVTGSIFKMTPSGTLTVLDLLTTANNTGYWPTSSGLIQGTDGNFYGLTRLGGSNNGTGTAYKVTSTGTMTFLHDFGDGTLTNDGANPYGNLIRGTDGNYYGTTLEGGTIGDGTVFKMTPTGTITILHSFGSVTNDGTYPEIGLLRGTDGKFYGTTTSGGTANDGTLFKITSAGSMTILHNFGDGSVANDGQGPLAVLIQASDGNFYGTTWNGGSASRGVIYKMTPAGSMTILHNFADGTIPNDGTNSAAGLIQGSDGTFYGLTYGGGTYNAGTVFKLIP